MFDEVDGSDEMLAWLKDDIEEAERLKREIEGEMRRLVERHLVYNWYLKKQPGLGPVLSAQLLGWMQPWRFKNPSAMIKYVGYSPASSEQHDRVGKTIVHKIAVSLIRKQPGSFWREAYEEFLERVRTTECREKCTRAHMHMKALRRLKRLFLSHYYCAYAIILRCRYGLDILPTTHYVANVHERVDGVTVRDIPSRYVPPCVPRRGVWVPLDQVVCR